ncbi:MAG: hypothetical protein M3Q49_05950 [Actinomycetota bacterium]|nr:hypothetical protein [Actinomycetota bacterium]
MALKSERAGVAYGTEVGMPSSPERPSEKQKGIIKRGLAYHVRGVAHRPGRDAFASGREAVCYAIAVKARVPRCRVQAGRMVADLLADRDVGIVTYASRQTRVGRGLQRRALRHLETAHGYRSDPEWLARLNAAVARKLAHYDAKERADFARDAKLYRAVILDPLVYGRRGRG